jgi:O-acetyl-ADP-ribose deacetylase (regulator of RNase III)
MVRYTAGDIFSSPAQVITNPVNCVGVMGAGLALEYKKRYKGLFADYQKRCQSGELRPGRPYLFESDSVQILNFPTKRHWQDKSKLEDIESGLKFLAENYADMGVFYLALPPLGCGLGGLDWAEVKALIDRHIGPIADLEVVVYEPVHTAGKSLKAPTTRKKSGRKPGMAAADMDL